MMALFVVCDHGYDCDNMECSYTHPHPGSTMEEAMCGHINKRVNIVEYQEIATCDPNYIFKRKKNGL